MEVPSASASSSDPSTDRDRDVVLRMLIELSERPKRPEELAQTPKPKSVVR